MRLIVVESVGGTEQTQKFGDLSPVFLAKKAQTLKRLNNPKNHGFTT